MKVGDVFYLRRGIPLTYEDLYTQLDKLIEGESYPVYSSKTTDEGLFGYLPYAMYPEKLFGIEGLEYIKNKPSNLFESITWTTDGIYAGTMYTRKGQFNATDRCGIMVLKEAYKDSVLLEWFVKKYQGKLFKEKRAQDTNGKVMKIMVEAIEMQIPPKEKQEEELNSINRLVGLKNKLSDIVDRIYNVLSKLLEFDKTTRYKTSDVFSIGTGERITYNDIYNNLLISSGEPNSMVPIISSGVMNDGIMGYGSIEWLGSITCKKKKKTEWDNWSSVGKNYIIETPCVTWNTDGSDVGTLFFRDYRFYPTDHCGVLIPKKEYKNKVNLKFFVYFQQYNFKKERGRANLHMKEMANTYFDLPDIELQNSSCKRIERLELYKKKIEAIIQRIDYLLSKDIL